MEGGSKGPERYSASSQRKHAEDESATRQEPRSAADATNRLQRPGTPTPRICGNATIRPRIACVKRPGLRNTLPKMSVDRSRYPRRKHRTLAHAAMSGPPGLQPDQKVEGEG